MIHSGNLRQLVDMSVLRVTRPSRQDGDKFQHPRDRDTRI